MLSSNAGKSPPATLVPGASLQAHNTLGVQACADYFIAVQDTDALAHTLQWYKQENKDRNKTMPLLLLGGGSNLVLSGDFHGLALKLQLLGREVIDENDQHVWLKVGAGENWHELVCHCMNFHWWGLENLALIPGNVGAAPVQNIGAYGVELQDCFSELSAVEISSGVTVNFDRNACRFGYRDSIFKQQFKDQYIITSVTLKLRKEAALKIDYPVLQQRFADQNLDSIAPSDVFDAVCDIRSSKLPDPAQIPNVGSFFKNPVVSAAQFEHLQTEFEGIVGFVQGQNQVKLAAGWLIDQAGWRGRAIGPARVHSEQALVLTNPGRGTGPEVLLLAQAIVDDVAARYGVSLEMEPRVY